MNPTPPSIPSSISSTPSISSVEPLSTLLTKSVDWDTKIKQIFEIVMSPSRVVAADSDSLVEQIPFLVQLIGEVSKSDMKDPHQSSPWMLEESFERMVEMFSGDRKNFLHFLTRISTQFIFPLSSVPPQIASIIQTERELVFYNFLARSNSGQVFLNPNKTINLSPVDYFFFAFAMLPLVDLTVTVTTSSFSQPASSQAPKTSSWWTSHSGDKKWHDESKSGTVYEKLLLNFSEIAFQGSLVTSPIDPQIVQGCQLAIAAWIDFYLSPALYSSGSVQLNFGKIFTITSKLCRTAILSQRARGLAPVFINRVVRLLTTLFSGGKCSRFVYRLDIASFASLVDLWYTVSAPWKILGESIEKHKEFIAVNSELYSSIVSILQSIPVQDFVADFHHAKSTDFNKFLSHKDTKIAVEILVKIFEVIGPVRDGSTTVIDLIPQSAGITKSGDATPAFRQIVEDMWNVARQCTWHDGYVPKQLSDESWRMDALVKVAKNLRGRKVFWGIFVWENPEGKNEEALDVPRRRQIFTPSKRVERRPETVIPELNWNSPICSNEIEIVVDVLKRGIEKYAGISLRDNPRKFSYVRKFANVTILLMIAFSLWMYVSIAWCPWMGSGSLIAFVQIFFVIVVGLLSLKLIGSQYVV